MSCLFYPYCLVWCLSDSWQLDGWMDGWYSYKFTALFSALTEFTQLGYFPFSTLSMNYVVFFPLFLSSQSPLYSILCLAHT